MGLARNLVIPVRRRTLDAAGDNSRATAGTGPGTKQTRGGDLDEDGLEGLVLEEAHKGLAVGAGREDVEVDDVGGGLVDVGLRGGEGLEVRGVGVADHDGAGAAGVARVRGGVLFTPLVSFPIVSERKKKSIVKVVRRLTNLEAQWTRYWPLAASHMASGAHTMPALEFSTTTSLSLLQLTRSVLSQTKMPLDPCLWAASQVV